MFEHDLQHYVTSVALLLQVFSNFMEGALHIRLTGVISIDRCAEIRSDPSVAHPLTAEFGGRRTESEAWSVSCNVAWWNIG